jgi:hypothetical protein
MMPALGAGGRWFESGRPHLLVSCKLIGDDLSDSFDLQRPLGCGKMKKKGKGEV